MLVPLFQRPYEWDVGSWQTLWDDIMEHYNRAEDDPPDASHFTGAIVTAPARSVPVGVSKYLVIDGQQRLTTLAILLCAIRNRMPTEHRQYRQISRLLLNEDYEGTDLYKLLPTQPDRPAWVSLLEDPRRSPASRFLRAFRFFVERLEGKDDDDLPIDPHRLFETVQQRLHVVFINLGENDDPYLIFESLNYKGTPLTQADLVRNYLLLRLQTGAQEKIYQQHWLPMQERLRDALPEFVRQYLMQKGEEVAKGDVYSVLKKRTLAVSDALMPAEIERLNAASVHYQYIIDPRTVKNARLQRSLTRLLRWEMATCHPLLLRLYTGHATGDVTDAELIDCLEIIESFGVRRYICGVPTNQLKRIFLSLMGVVQRGQTAANLRANLAKGSLGRRWPKDVEFKAAWLKFRLYSRPVDRCKFILESLEDAHGHREGGDPSAATIEHIMPQTLSPAWREAPGANAEATHEQWLHTVGNLTLSAYNSELSNSAFGRKKDMLADSHFELNRSVVAQADWDAVAIEQRAGALCTLAQNVWARPP
ncbi:MAG: DUF262 domain-containing protein [Deltaproteobacteria bacterium]|nr:DUF262 domain-containing protein [Deltaproteobacteria bacterium]